MGKPSYEYKNFTNNDFKTDLIIYGASTAVIIVLVFPWLIGCAMLAKWMFF